MTSSGSNGAASAQNDGSAEGPALVVEKLSKTFGLRYALRDVSFSVPRGSVFGLLGPNGAGKTTLFSIVAGFIRASAGEARVLGVRADRSADLRGRLSILPQDALFSRSMPILEQMVFLLRLEGRKRSDAESEVRAALERVGLADVAETGAHTLSHGMYRRLGIAQALLGDPELLILDEPTGGLDPHSARKIRDLIGSLGGERTVIVSSHNLAEVEELASHVAILDRGRLVAASTIEEIRRSARSLEVVTARPLEAEETAALAAIHGVAAIEARGPQRYRVRLDLETRTLDEVLAELLRWLLDRGIVPREVHAGFALEDHFLQVTSTG